MSNATLQYNFGEFEKRVELFNYLLKVNQALEECDAGLTMIQEAVMRELVLRMEGTADSFYNDCNLFMDLCHAYEGNVTIEQKPKDFQPLVRTPTLWRLLDAELLKCMECETSVRIAGGRYYYF